MKRVNLNVLLGLTLVLLLTTTLVGCSSKANEASGSDKPADKQAGKILIRVAIGNTGTHPSTIALREKFKPRVEELTGGKAEVQVFDSGQLGGERDTIEQMQIGTLEMNMVSPVLGNIDPKFNITDLPYLFKDEDHVDRVLDGPIGQEILKDLPSKGLRGFAFAENGFRVVTNNKRPIEKLEDLRGLKIRVPEAPISVAIMNALGANTATIAFNELYSALQQGVIDGQENAYATILSSGFYEVQKYLAETNHMWGAHIMVASEKWWQTLPKDVQDAIATAAKETGTYARSLFRKYNQECKEKLIKEKGMVYTQPDPEPFRRAVQVVYDDFYKKYPDLKPLVEKIIAARS